MICLLLVAFLLVACGETKTENTQQSGETIATPEKEDLFTENDKKTDYDDEKVAYITLNGQSVTCSSNAVQVTNGSVTIIDEGTYVLSGSFNGMVVVNAQKQDKVRLVLSNAQITSSSGAAVYVKQADKVFITLEGENYLSNGGTFTAVDDSNIDAVLFSKDDLTLNGEGKLTLESPVGHGIVSKDDLTVTGGNYVLTTAGHGMESKDNLCVAGGSFTISAGKDGIRSENTEDATLGYVYMENGTFQITAEGDGISASGKLDILGGDYTITTGGGSENGQKKTSDNWGGFGGGRGPGGMGGWPGGGGNTTATEADSTSIKGIKAGGDLTIRNGNFNLNCADDSIHSNANLSVSGGMFTIATGDDGFHADDTLTITAGTVNITESYEGLEALHILVQGGDIQLKATDDGLNAAGGTDQSGFGGNRNDMFGGRGPGGMGGSGNGSIHVSGGTLYVVAHGDGMDANGTLEISGGYTIVTGPTQGDTATLDFDTTGTISGGVFIGTGGTMMAQTFSDVKQGLISLQVGNRAADSRITLADASGKVLIDHSPELPYAIVILSCPEMISGENYTFTIGTDSGVFIAE